ncbi:MAG: phage holin family protein [Sphingomonadaceae bacterium]|uniref:phage holin family protein n=1 Tax=Thermaurantiacus sp. TaxID=2820283 RepID=UPI00298ED9CD|nr:phage holin family protein [Thermaurantiacus sp.]MCS6986784.1 phage holin family protein [Sphingomonadaceae bacterium]MDW8413953.1 phage holin family protein [Thermaurantiacus sp.]
MATRPEDLPPADEEARLAESVKRLLADAGRLARLEATLARLETQANLQAAGHALQRMALGFLLLSAAGLLAAAAGLVGLARFLGWAPALAVSALGLGLSGAWLFHRGRRRLRTTSLLPQRTLARLTAASAEEPAP